MIALIAGALSRAEIAWLTVLSSQAISYIVGELESATILKAAAHRKAGRGQPATPLSLAQGDRRLQRWVGSVLPAMRRAVNILESILDPDAFVLGGFLPLPILKMLFERLEPLPPSIGARRARTSPRILLGAAGRETSALGAAALPIFDEINPQFDVLLKPQRG